MSANSWVVLECLIVLALLGAASFFVRPAYELGVGIIIGAVVALLNSASGQKAGASMPEQASETKTDTSPPPASP